MLIGELLYGFDHVKQVVFSLLALILIDFAVSTSAFDIVDVLSNEV